MDTEIVLDSLGLANYHSIIASLRNSKSLKFLLTNDNIESFYKVLLAAYNDLTNKDNRRIISAVNAAFKYPKYQSYKNFMGKVTARSDTPLHMMYKPAYTTHIGADVPTMRSEILKAFRELEHSGDDHIKILGNGATVYEVSLNPNVDATKLTIKVVEYNADREIEPETLNLAHSKHSLHLDLVNRLNSSKALTDDHVNLLNSYLQQKLQKPYTIDIMPIDFDAPVFPQAVLDIMRTYDSTFSELIGSKSKGEIIENTTMFVSRLIAILAQEPDSLMEMTGNRYIVNDYSKLEPLVSHVIASMSVISSKFFK